MVLYTSDVHCGVDKGFGFAGLEQIRKYEQNKGSEVILVDNGDMIQGDALGMLTKGEALIDLMNRMGYSVAIPGNHEFDYGMDNFLSLADKAKFKYISCNFRYKDKNVFDPYVIREIGGRKIAFVGVTTPKTLTSSTPAVFQDGKGNYVYSFLEDESGGAVRVSIPAGDITMKNIYEVFPFANEKCVIEASGQQILDALEWGARSVPDESGGFLQTSGMTYEIHTYIDSSCTKDEKGMFTGIEGERRVKNVKVGGSPIDPEAHYKVAGTDYYLINNGDGHTAFDGDERLDAAGTLDTQILYDYLTQKLGGVVGQEYSDPTGQDRIVIVEERPSE